MNKKIIFAVVLTFGVSLAVSIGYAGMLINTQSVFTQGPVRVPTVTVPTVSVTSPKVEEVKQSYTPVKHIDTRTGAETALELRITRLEARVSALEAKLK